MSKKGLIIQGTTKNITTWSRWTSDLRMIQFMSNEEKPFYLKVTEFSIFTPCDFDNVRIKINHIRNFCSEGRKEYLFNLFYEMSRSANKVKPLSTIKFSDFMA